MKNDYYAILGVPRDSDEREIRKAYRARVMETHPDRRASADPDAFLKIQEAYETLRDPGKRSAYDREEARREREERIYGERAFRRREWSGVRGGAWGGARGFRRGRFGPSFARGGVLYCEVFLSVAEAWEGVRIPIAIPVWLTCFACGGTGREGFWLCPFCGGRGGERSVREAVLHIPPYVEDGTELEFRLHELNLEGAIRCRIRVY